MKYYLPQSNEAGFLFYEADINNRQVSIYESGCGILVRIDIPAYKNKGLISDTELALELLRMFNLKEKTAYEVVKAFSLPDVLQEGTVFSNSTEWIGLSGDWEDNIKGFLTDKDICVLLFKKSGGGAAAEFVCGNQWLSYGLFESDGKTRVVKDLKK